MCCLWGKRNLWKGKDYSFFGICEEFRASIWALACFGSGTESFTTPTVWLWVRWAILHDSDGVGTHCTKEPRKKSKCFLSTSGSFIFCSNTFWLLIKASVCYDKLMKRDNLSPFPDCVQAKVQLSQSSRFFLLRLCLQLSVQKKKFYTHKCKKIPTNWLIKFLGHKQLWIFIFIVRLAGGENFISASTSSLT